MRYTPTGAAAGYSSTPLAKKLGIKPGTRVVVSGEAVDYLTFFDALPDGVRVVDGFASDETSQRAINLDDAAEHARADAAEKLEAFLHHFTTDRVELEGNLPRLKARLAKDGVLWVSWPKRASGVATDVTEDTVRELALAVGLVDVKVCAVDAVWSGLKLVYRLRDR